MPDIEGLAMLIAPLGLNNQQVLRFVNGYHRNCEVLFSLVVLISTNSGRTRVCQASPILTGGRVLAELLAT